MYPLVCSAEYFSNSAIEMISSLAVAESFEKKSTKLRWYLLVGSNLHVNMNHLRYWSKKKRRDVSILAFTAGKSSLVKYSFSSSEYTIRGNSKVLSSPFISVSTSSIPRVCTAASLFVNNSYV